MKNYFDSFKDCTNVTFDLDMKIHGSDRRKVPRKPCLILANYNINQQFYSSFILDINDAGVFVETDRTFPTGEEILLQYLDPYSKRSSLIDGLVAWSSDAAIGVKFNYHLFTPF